MPYVPPKLRLRVDAGLADGTSLLYVLALEDLSIVAALRELAWQLSVALSESHLKKAEYAAALIEVLRPMAGAAYMLPAKTRWKSHATLRVRCEPRMIEGSDGTEDTLVFEFRVHDIEVAHDSPDGELTAVYQEEMAIVRELNGFTGDAAALLERLQVLMARGAVVAKAQLFYRTVQRAQMGLHCVYTEDPATRKRLQEYADWLVQLQGEVEGRSTGPSA